MGKEGLLEKLDEFLDQINQQYPIEFAYLFGSFATEKYNKESDIDIAIMFQEKYESKREVIIKGNIIDMGMKYFQRKLDVISLNSATPLLKYEVVRKGILLKESKRRAEFESLALREYFDFRYYAEAYNKAMIEAIKKEI
ncbi:type VII toxin-antitoxin system MntA family adenylyltransferase antitoxin [Alkaliphilus peptidifermentans]|uniref:Predicted nucleotidyltransferase n=1 Tax=Alkaliphilus peptidifermentans DSM 18978 TaxID=1120976 RepID=A0A1G5BQA3_9FIRM|nr:nucleotidyltransferase domain-containing protein [Alkaliphilus peptidifermentans]SCX92331.1 Predicted nucleotidyltransferase [Alkaliphilus peptidifermentans DSM 18978]